MSDFKSKLPDMKDITSITTKLFKDLKNSVTEIITDYKKKHFQEETKKTTKPSSAKKTTQAKSAEPAEPAEPAKPKKTTKK